jgi:hypothetical protein
MSNLTRAFITLGYKMMDDEDDSWEEEGECLSGAAEYLRYLRDKEVKG